MAPLVPTVLFVGSTNPVKINAVKSACSSQWPTTKVEGFSTNSGVPDQPLTESQTRKGARNRAREALKKGVKQFGSDHQQLCLGVGLEGGVDKLGDGLYSVVWVAVTDGQDFFESAGARFRVPEPVASLILAGGEMGPVMEQLVGESDVRSKQGMIGIITNNFVDRTSEYAGIAAMALGLWYGRDWQVGLINA